MGARDIITVEYFSDNRRFADIMNGRVFSGKRGSKTGQAGRGRQGIAVSMDKERGKSPA